MQQLKTLFLNPLSPLPPPPSPLRALVTIRTVRADKYFEGSVSFPVSGPTGLFLAFSFWSFSLSVFFCSCLAVKQAEEEAEQLRGVQHAAVAEQDERLHQLNPNRGVLTRVC